MNIQFTDFSEVELNNVEGQCRNYLEAETEQVTNSAMWVAVRERLTTWLGKLETTLLTDGKFERKHRAEVFLTGLRWEIGHALKAAHDRHEIYGKLQPLVADTIKRVYGSVAVLIQG